MSRTGRLAVLQVDSRPPDEVVAPGAFLQLSLPLSLYLGGVPAFHAVSPKVRARGSFVGCIQKVGLLMESHSSDRLGLITLFIRFFLNSASLILFDFKMLC